VHAGEIHVDDNGFFGEALDLACRLLDAPVFKKTLLRATTAPAALVVSDDIFWSIVKHGYEGLREETFQFLAASGPPGDQGKHRLDRGGRNAGADPRR
jgi:hypothetical protein